LFRGGNPNLQAGGIWTFNYEGLVSTMRQAANLQDLDLPPKFYLIDIKNVHSRLVCAFFSVAAGRTDPHDAFPPHSLTNMEEDGDADLTIAEWKYFRANPSLGKFVFWCGGPLPLNERSGLIIIIIF